MRGAEHVEEATEALDSAILADPKQPTDSLVDLVNDREIVMAGPNGDLVDADGLNTVKGSVGDPVINDLTDCAIDNAPTSSEERGDFAPRKAAGPARQEQSVDITARVLALGPGNFLDGDVALCATLAKYPSLSIVPPPSMPGQKLYAKGLVALKFAAQDPS